MRTPVNFLKRYPVMSYYLLVFLISWGGVIALVGNDGFPAAPNETTRLFPVALTFTLAGPFLAGLIMTGVLFGKGGYRNLVRRIVNRKIGARWYVLALFFIPTVVGSILWILSQTLSVFIPNIVSSDDKAALIASGIGIGLAGGFFEEVGWTGFVTPLIRTEHGIVVTGLVAGFIWGLWHVLITWWASGDTTGRVSCDLLLPPLVFYVGVLPAYRVIMVWTYDRTESLLIVMLMHASLTASTLFLFLPPATGNSLIRYYFILSAVLWVIIVNLPNKWTQVQKSIR